MRTNSSLLFEALRVIELVRSLAKGVEVCVLVENVKSMDSHGPESRREFSRLLNVLPICACPSTFGDVRRPRYYWVNWTIWGSHCASVEEEAERTLLKLKGDPPQWASRLDANTVRDPEFNNPFSTFVQAIPRKKPPFRPAGLEACSKKALDRWERDCYRYPPYQYEDKNGVLQNGKWRPLNSRERSVRMGFDWHHCEPAFPKNQRKADPQRFEDVACSLIGNSFSCPVVAWLFGQKLCELGVLTDRPSLENCWGVRRAPSENCTLPTVEHMDALKVLHRNVMYRGSDVRVATQTLVSPGIFPRKSLDASRWKWGVVLAFPLKGLHINALELQAIVATLRWRLRKAAAVGKRFTHCVDSQVCMAVCCKGRSSSRILCRILHILNSLSLASSTHTVYAYIRSADNPADRPSRWRSFSFGRRG